MSGGDEPPGWQIVVAGQLRMWLPGRANAESIADELGGYAVPWWPEKDAGESVPLEDSDCWGSAA